LWILEKWNFLFDVVYFQEKTFFFIISSFKYDLLLGLLQRNPIQLGRRLFYFVNTCGFSLSPHSTFFPLRTK